MSAVTDVQRHIRRTRITRRVTALAVPLNTLAFAANLAVRSPLVFVNLALGVVLPVLFVVLTCLLGIWRRLEPVLARPRMTPEDWRQLREMEAELGWELTEIPATVAEPDPVVLGNGIVIGHIPDGAITAGHITADMITAKPVRMFPAGESDSTGGGAPMTGPGGRWRPVSELPEVSAAAHFAALAEAGRESCAGFCPVCAARNAPPETCANCGQPIEDSHKIEFSPGAFRAVTTIVHAGTGLEQCDGRETSAERRSEPGEAR